jgi:NAD-dependent dihydropyrimidine dehydrogenase PreA subunit
VEREIGLGCFGDSCDDLLGRTSRDFSRGVGRNAQKCLGARSKPVDPRLRFLALLCPLIRLGGNGFACQDRCGACLNACPVYKNIGGHAYETPYSGPIGSVITPHLKEMGEWKHLSYASSLCGNCTEVCAVKINLHELLLENRHEAVDEGHNVYMERMAWKMWRIAMQRRSFMNLGNRTIKNWVVNKLLKGWKENRTEIKFPKKSFNQLWKEKYGNR